MEPADIRAHLEGAVPAHELERGQPLLLGQFRQARDGVLEDVTVVLVDGELLPGSLLRLEVPPDAEAPVGVDAPGELDPELVLLPDVAGVRLARVAHGPAESLTRGPEHRLAERDPLAVVLLVGVQVVPLGAEPHRQHVVGEEGGLAPGRGERDVETDEALVGERLDPREPVGVRPDGVVDAREVHLEAAAPLLQEVRQEERELVQRQRELVRPGQLVPAVRVGRQVDRRAARTCSRRSGTSRRASRPRRAARSGGRGSARPASRRGCRPRPSASCGSRAGSRPWRRSQPSGESSRPTLPTRARRARRCTGRRARPGCARTTRTSAPRPDALRPGTRPSSTSGVRTRGRRGRGRSGGSRSASRMAASEPGSARATGRRASPCSTGGCRGRSTLAPLALASITRWACGLK